MSIVPDECDERRTHIDRMIDEFRKAQSRRIAKAAVVKGTAEVVESPRDAQAQAAAAGSTTAPASHEND